MARCRGSAPAEAAVSRVLCPGGRLRPPGGGHSSRTSIAAGLQRAYPEARPDQPPRGTLWIPRYASLFALAPGGACRAADIAACAVRSYRTFSPLPDRFSRAGGLFSVALSCGSPRPAVGRRPVLWSSDFPPVRPPERAVTPAFARRLRRSKAGVPASAGAGKHSNASGARRPGRLTRPA